MPFTTSSSSIGFLRDVPPQERDTEACGRTSGLIIMHTKIAKKGHFSNGKKSVSLQSTQNVDSFAS